MLLLQQMAGHHDALDLVGALVDLGDPGSAHPVPTLRLIRVGWRCVEHHGGTRPGDTDAVTRAAQVTGLLDLRATRAVLRGGCQVHSRSTAGQSKVAPHRQPPRWPKSALARPAPRPAA